MNTDEHTVTVPISDYNEMVEAYEELKDILENVLIHQKWLKESGLDMKIDLTKVPVDCRFVNNHAMSDTRGTSIIFQYQPKKE